MLELSPLVTAASAAGLLDAGLDEAVAVEADALHRVAGEVGAEAGERRRPPVDDGDGVPVVESEPGRATSRPVRTRR